MFNNKFLLITGGTGSFGNAVLKRFLDTDIAEIRIFSRDEKKQADTRKRYKNLNSSPLVFPHVICQLLYSLYSKLNAVVGGTDDASF